MFTYKISNLINGNVYFSVTRNIEDIWAEHKKSARMNCQQLLYHSIRKYGEENFTIEEVEEFSDRDDAFNGKKLRGRKLTEEHKKSISEGLKNAEPRSQETFSKISKSLTGRKLSEDHIQKTKNVAKERFGVKIVLQNVNNGSVKYFDTIRECADFLQFENIHNYNGKCIKKNIFFMNSI